MYSVTRIRIDIQVCAAGTRRNSGPKAYEKPMFRHQQVHINIPKMPKPKVVGVAPAPGHLVVSPTAR